MGKHTSAYQIPLASLNLRGKKSCDPLFHLALFHFRRILGRRGSWWEKCCKCFKMFFYHQSRTKWRSTHVKATLRRLGLVWVDRKWFSNVPSVEVQCMCMAGVFVVICDYRVHVCTHLSSSTTVVDSRGFHADMLVSILDTSMSACTGFWIAKSRVPPVPL